MAKGQADNAGGSTGAAGKSQQQPATPADGTRSGPVARVSHVQAGRGRNNSGTTVVARGGGVGGQPPAANVGRGTPNPKGPPPATSNPVSVAARYQKPGGGRSFGGPPQVDVLTPTVPPLYPTAPKPSPLNLQVNDRVAVYKRFCQYFSSNYGVHLPRRAKCGFNVDRYTDIYKAPLTVNPDIVHRVGSLRLPSELTSTKPYLKKVRKAPLPTKKRVIEDLPDEEEQKDGSGAPVKKKPHDEDQPAAPTNEILEDEEMEEADEELDMGTDYLANYFDNGEDFLDGDNEPDEEGPTF